MTQNINLYDASLRLSRDWLAPAPFAGMAGGALLATLLAALVLRWDASRLERPAHELAAALHAQQASLQELARQVDTLRPSPLLVDEVARTQTTLQQRQAALQLLRAGGLGHEDGHAAALRAFARQSIEGLWLTALVLDRSDMALRGRAMHPELIPAYVGRLNQEPALQGRALRALDIQRPPDGETAAKGPGTPEPVQRLAPYVEFALAGTALTLADSKVPTR